MGERQKKEHKEKKDSKEKKERKSKQSDKKHEAIAWPLHGSDEALTMCSYNATHVIKATQLSKHEKVCPDRSLFKPKRT